jgi:hypothetical protein
VHWGGSAGFFADKTTLVGILPATAANLSGQIPVVGSFQVDQTIPGFVKVVAVDFSGNRSSASAAAPCTPRLLKDEFIDSLTVSKLTAGTLTANTILGASIATAPSGRRVELRPEGIRAYNTNGARTVDLSTVIDPNLTFYQGTGDPSGSAYTFPPVQVGYHDGNKWGIKVQDLYGTTKVLLGQLVDASLAGDDYGVAAVNSLGQLVKLDTICFGQKAAYNTAADATTSTTYVSLGGPIVTDVAVGNTGRCEIVIGAQMDTGGNDFGIGAAFSFQVTRQSDGVVVKPSSNGWSCVARYFNGASATNNSLIDRKSYTHFFDDLTPGLYTIEMQYRTLNAAISASFSDRTLIAKPF